MLYARLTVILMVHKVIIGELIPNGQAEGNAEDSLNNFLLNFLTVQVVSQVMVTIITLLQVILVHMKQADYSILVLMISKVLKISFQKLNQVHLFKWGVDIL